MRDLQAIVLKPVNHAAVLSNDDGPSHNCVQKRVGGNRECQS
jgi:hypothetical protein